MVVCDGNSGACGCPACGVCVRKRGDRALCLTGPQMPANCFMTKERVRKGSYFVSSCPALSPATASAPGIMAHWVHFACLFFTTVLKLPLCMIKTSDPLVLFILKASSPCCSCTVSAPAGTMGMAVPSLVSVRGPMWLRQLSAQSSCLSL